MFETRCLRLAVCYSGETKISAVAPLSVEKCKSSLSIRIQPHFKSGVTKGEENDRMMIFQQANPSTAKYARICKSGWAVRISTSVIWRLRRTQPNEAFGIREVRRVLE